MNTTIYDVIQYILLTSLLIGAIGGIVGAVRAIKSKTIDKTVDESITKRLEPYMDTLERIDDNYKNLGTEISLLIQLNMTMISELRNGHLNGETTAAIQRLNAYLIDQATKMKE